MKIIKDDRLLKITVINHIKNQQMRERSVRSDVKAVSAHHLHKV